MQPRSRDPESSYSQTERRARDRYALCALTGTAFSIICEFRANFELRSRLFLFLSSYSVFRRIPSFFPLPCPSRPSRFAHLSRSVAIGFRYIRRIKAHAMFRVSPCGSWPLFVVARADAIAPVARLRRYARSMMHIGSASDKKRRTQSFPSVRQSMSEFFGSFTVSCIATLSLRRRNKDRCSKETRFDFRQSAGKHTRAIWRENVHTPFPICLLYPFKLAYDDILFLLLLLISLVEIC